MEKPEDKVEISKFEQQNFKKMFGKYIQNKHIHKALKTNHLL